MNDNTEQTSVVLCEESTQPRTQDVNNPEATILQQKENLNNPRRRSKLMGLLRLLFVRYEKLNMNAQYIFDAVLEGTANSVFSVGRILLYGTSVLFLVNAIVEIKTIITDFSVKGVLSVAISVLFWLFAFWFGRLSYFMWKELSRCSEKEIAAKAANVLSLLLAIFSCFLAIFSIS